MENMGMNAGGPDSEVKNLLLQGFRAAKENRREEAYQLFCDVVARDPNNEYGWLYRAATTDSRSEAYVCLEKVLSINPNNTKAQRGLERIREQQQEESDSEGESDSGQTYAAVPPETGQGRVGTNDYISDYDQTGPQRGVYETPAPAQSSGYPFPVEDGRASSYPAYGNEAAYSSFDRPNVPPPPPPSDNYGGFNSMDTQPRPSYDNYYPNQADNAAPAMPSYEEEPQDGAQAATRQRLRRGKKAAGAGFGAETATDLDDTGRQRQQRARSGLLIPLILLLLIAAIVVGVLYLMGRNNNTGTDQAAIDAANATSTAAAAVTTGTATVAGGAGSTTATSGTGATTAAGGTGATTAAGSTTAAGGTGATTAAGNANATTAASGTGATTAAGGGTNTTPPAANTTAAPANTTPPPANTTATPATTAPPAANTTAASGGSTGGTAVSTRPVLYTVVAGDNLTKISRQFGTSPDAIRAANRYTQPITGDAIFGGNRYIIPVSRPDFRGSGHIVAQGDTLDSIAAKYGTTADAIVKLNGLSGPSDIKPGDPLLIP